MIRFGDVTITYPDADRPALADVTLEIPAGELAVVVGETGSGKSTLLGAISGLVPHFTGGHLAGEVSVAGRSTRDHRPRDLADVVGTVVQSPAEGFVTDLVEDEIAYTMENLATDPAVMRRRVEEMADLLGLAGLRRRALQTLSQGEQQRVAIASVLAAGPQVLVLDEPTSALDPGAAEDVLAALSRLVHDLGVTVVMAEHRLERVIQVADSVIEVADGTARRATPAAAMASSSVAPPVVELGRLAGWDPLPLSIRDARRAATAQPLSLHRDPPALAPTPVGPTAISVEGVTVRWSDDHVGLDQVTLSVAAGEVVAVMGRNGSGKTTLLRTMAGLQRPDAGSVTGADDVAFVPADPALIMCETTVAAEMAGVSTDPVVGTLDPDAHPRDLSEGQRLGLALAVMTDRDPAVLLLDEPTRGLDYSAKARLVEVLRSRAAAGRATVVATHDVELVAAAATRAVMLADGEVVADSDNRTMAASSPMFAPQVHKILAPLPYLTVAEVATALDR